MKKNWLIVAFLLILFPAFVNAENQKVKVGVILPMTGNAADYGNTFWSGCKTAMEKLGDQTRVELILEDSKADPKVGISVAQKLINYDGVKVIVGGISPVMLAITPIAEQSDIVVINPVANSPKLSGLSNYLFNSTPLSNEEAEFLATTAFKTYNKRKAAVLYINNESGLGFRDNFSKRFKEFGGKIVYEEAIPLGESDFRTIIQKMKRAQPDFVFLATYYKESALIIKQSKELKYNPFWLSYSAVETPEFLKLAAGTADDLIYSYSGFDISAKNTQEFVSVYRKLFGKDPDIWSGQFYEAVIFLNEAINNIKDFNNFGNELIKILSTNKFNGLSGRIEFDEKHSIKGRFSLKTIKNNTFVIKKG